MRTIATGLGTRIKVMPFRNPKFHKGVNCTARKGETWKCLKVGETFMVEHISAVVVKVLRCRLKDLKDKDIKYEHDPECRTLKGLKNCLYGIYPEMMAQKKESVITVIYFSIL